MRGASPAAVANGHPTAGQSSQPPPTQPVSGDRPGNENATDQQPTADKPAGSPTEAPPFSQPSDQASIKLLRMFTDGIVDERIERAMQVLADGNLTANEKLTKIDALIRIPATASAEQLGGMLGLTKQAVLKTDWWIENRRGERDNEIGRRRAQHRRRAEGYEGPTAQNSD